MCAIGDDLVEDIRQGVEDFVKEKRAREGRLVVYRGGLWPGVGGYQHCGILPGRKVEGHARRSRKRV